MFRASDRKIKTLVCGLVSVLVLSMVQLPKALAADNCFVSADAINRVDDPYRSGNIMIPIDATCAMKLYSMDVSFYDADNVDGLNAGYSTYWHDGIDHITDDGVHIAWNTDESDPETKDGRPYIDVEAGESLFGYWYDIPLETEVFKHNMAVTINSARYEIDGEMKTVENLVLDAIVTITPDEAKDVSMISGVEKQDVTYTGQPVVLEGELKVEENDDNITAADLTEQYYVYDDSDSSFTPIERPTDPGEFYLVEYSFENDNYRASLRVPFTIKDYIVTDLDIRSGHGEVSAPQYVDKGGDLHVDIIPTDGYEVMWVEYNGYDVTDLLNDDYSLDVSGVDENANIVVAFRPFYLVTEGDGGEYKIGSGKGLAFVVDKEPTSYSSDEVVIAVDDEFIDMRNDSVVEPEMRTTTLLSSYLDTLEPGEHKFEIYFFDMDDVAGIARATFMVVEAEEELIPVPDTGTFTENVSNVEMSGVTMTLSGIAVAIILFAIRRSLKKEA